MATKKKKRVYLSLEQDDYDALQLYALRDGCGDDAKDYIHKLIDADLRHRGRE